MRVPVVWRPEAREDFRNLPSDEVRDEAARYIRLIGRKPKFGIQLDFLPETGDLSDCFKIFINNRQHRIIYRPVPNADRPKVIDLIIIGEREHLDAYVEAVRRLRRDPGVAATE